MSRFLCILVLGMMPMIATAQYDDPVTEVERRWADALVAGDLETVAEVMHPLFRLVRTYQGGSSISKDEYLALPGMKVHSASIEPLSISYYGAIATVSMDYLIDWESPDGKLPGHFRIFDTLVFTEGRWLVLERVSETVDE